MPPVCPSHPVPCSALTDGRAGLPATPTAVSGCQHEGRVEALAREGTFLYFRREQLGAGSYLTPLDTEFLRSGFRGGRLPFRSVSRGLNEASEARLRRSAQPV